LAAFNQAGGHGRLIVAEPFGNDGHTLFSQKGIPVWSGYVDSFLRDQGLTLTTAPVAVSRGEVSPPSMLSAKGREAFADFLAAPDHKAFVASPSGAWAWRSGRRTEEEAVAGAMEKCKPKSGESCELVMVDSTANTDDDSRGEVSPPSMLSAEGRKAFANFLAAPDHKAFAASPSGAWGWRSGRRTEEEAVAGALEKCRDNSAQSCELIMVDSTPR
ncbi:MAG: hypothetical protein J0626_01315, partial [Rhodospirillaceae bacterium]|nr:hypothetical protein [Rhodospirillaceae bacterium]